MPEEERDILREIELAATRLAREAGRRLVESIRRPLTVEYKSRFHRDPVTELDREVEGFLTEQVRQLFPSHGILGEEGADFPTGGAQYLWVLDPLDGTTNFVGGLPVFAVSIGVLKDLQPAVGAVFVSVGPRLEPGVFHARRGGGCFFEEERVEIGGGQPLRQLAGLPAHYHRIFRVGGDMRFRMGEVRTLGSVAFELALASAGVLDYIAFGGPRIWDVAAGVLLVQEAGGLVLHRTRRLRRWTPLDSFQPQTTTASPGSAELKGWTASIIAGRRPSVEFAARHLRRRRRRWWPVLSWWRRRQFERQQRQRMAARGEEGQSDSGADAPAAQEAPRSRD